MPALDKSSSHRKSHPRPQPNRILADGVQKAAAVVNTRFTLTAPLALVLGSGLGDLVKKFNVQDRIPYSRIPGFGQTTVPGHTGELLLASLQNSPLVLIFSGRRHYYEACPVRELLLPVRLAAALGVRDILLTNAAGSLHKSWAPGNWMRIKDHINFMGFSPLRESCDSFENRFVNLCGAYDSALGDLLDSAAKKAGVKLKTGVYLAVAGPNYETPAEIRAFKRLGADAVGMSTVPEVIAARQLGLRVGALSCLTNLAAGLGEKPPEHREVLENGRTAQISLLKLLNEFLQSYARSCR